MNILSRYKLLLFVLLLGMSVTTIAQKQNVYYLKNNEKRVSTLDSADYIRVVNGFEHGVKLYAVKEYYTNQAIKLIGYSQRVDYDQFEGQVVSFFKNGKKKQLATYKDGYLAGNCYNYYPNGVLYTYKVYADHVKGADADHSDENYTIQACNDSTGNPMVTDGNGHYVGYDSDFTDEYEEGNVKDGQKDGEWTGNDEYGDFEISFIEQYKKGKLLSAQSINDDGERKSYTQRYTRPEFTADKKGFMHFFDDHMRFPKKSVDENNNGRIYLKFVIQPDGILTDAEIFKATSKGYAVAALQSIRLSPKWVPATFFGWPVKFEYTMPVNFLINYDEW